MVNGFSARAALGARPDQNINWIFRLKKKQKVDRNRLINIKWKN